MKINTVRRLAAATAVVATSTVALAACGSSGAGHASQKSDISAAQAHLTEYANGKTPTAPTAIAKMPDLKGKTVWWVPLSNNIPIIQQTGQALSAALQQVGATVHVCDGNLVPTTIGSCLTSAANQGASAVVTGFVDYAMIPAAFDTLQAEHIPTLIAGEPPSDGKTDTSTLAFYSYSALSDLREQLAADWAIADSKGSANALLIRMTDSSATLENAAAAQQEFQTNCSGCTVTTVDMATKNMDRLQSTVSAALVSHPNIDYVVAPLDTDTPQISQAIGSAGRTGKVKVAADGVQYAGLQLVQSDSLSADVGDSIEYSGWSIGDALLRLLAGEKVGKLDDGTLKVFTAGNVKSLDVTASAAGGSDWYGGAAWKQDFLTAWGVKGQ